jgi:hypothetical protein
VEHQNNIIKSNNKKSSKTKKFKDSEKGSAVQNLVQDSNQINKPSQTQNKENRRKTRTL